MVDEFLNQDEIDALLSGSPGEGGGKLSQDDIAALGEVAGIVATAASNVVGMLAGRDVSADVIDQIEIRQGEMASKIDGGKVFVYSMTLGGMDAAPARLITSERGALALADMMMGGDARELPGEANDLYLSAAQEGLSQLVGSALTNLSGLLAGVRLSADATASALLDLSGWLPFSDLDADTNIWVGRVNLNVSGVEPFMLDISMPADVAANFAAKIRDATAPKEEPAPLPTPTPASRPAAASRPAQPTPPPPVPQAAPSYTPPPRPQAPPVDVKPVEFTQLGGPDSSVTQGNLDLIVDIPVRITVELGRTRKTIGEVLALGPGSVVELNKMAGEPVDVLVNGKLIARGEVVVIDESFGIRVTEVVSRSERIRSMGV
ncbi:MAG: flagellar motor switch protein FliN [Synergistaceae bacterium]|jgi:flagellar motor switch protein FliN/FliY|nr:flagellar motor switch protein FliN [Synergistaceae bacterium]